MIKGDITSPEIRHAIKANLRYSLFFLNKYSKIEKSNKAAGRKIPLAFTYIERPKITPIRTDFFNESNDKNRYNAKTEKNAIGISVYAKNIKCVK